MAFKDNIPIPDARLTLETRIDGALGADLHEAARLGGPNVQAAARRQAYASGRDRDARRALAAAARARQAQTPAPADGPRQLVTARLHLLAARRAALTTLCAPR